VTISSDQVVTAVFDLNPSLPAVVAPPVAPRCTINVTDPTVRVQPRRIGARHHGNQSKTTRASITASVECDQAVHATITGIVSAVDLKRPSTRRRREPTTYRLAVTREFVPVNLAHTTRITLPMAAVTALVRGARESPVLTLTATDGNGSALAHTKVAILRIRS
jgi:hypothetical protein